jgi:hypothetical protein
MRSTVTLLIGLLIFIAILALFGAAAQRWGVDSRRDWDSDPRPTI